MCGCTVQYYGVGEGGGGGGGLGYVYIYRLRICADTIGYEKACLPSRPCEIVVGKRDES